MGVAIGNLCSRVRTRAVPCRVLGKLELSRYLERNPGAPCLIHDSNWVVMCVTYGTVTRLCTSWRLSVASLMRSSIVTWLCMLLLLVHVGFHKLVTITRIFSLQFTLDFDTCEFSKLLSWQHQCDLQHEELWASHQVLHNKEFVDTFTVSWKLINPYNTSTLWEQLPERQQNETKWNKTKQNETKRNKTKQRKYPRGNFNLRESLNQKNIASDFIYVEVFIQANMASDAVWNFQHRRQQSESPRWHIENRWRNFQASVPKKGHML